MTDYSKKLFESCSILIVCTVLFFVLLADFLDLTRVLFMGVETEVKVMSLDHVSASKSTGKIHHYNLEIKGRKVILSTSKVLAIGSSVVARVDPGNPKNFRVGETTWALVLAEALFIFASLAGFVFGLVRLLKALGRA